MLDIKIMNVTVANNTSIQLVLKGLKNVSLEDFNISIYKVEKDYTTFACTSRGQLITKDEKSFLLDFPHTSVLTEGLYLIGEIQIYSNSTGEHFNYSVNDNDFNLCLFEVCKTENVDRTHDQLIKELEVILKNREEKFNKGFGLSSEEIGVKEYEGYVFVKDCLLTGEFRLSNYEIIPIEGLSCLDELELMRSVLFETAEDDLQNHFKKTIENAKSGQPCFVVHFPKVYARSIEETGQLMSDEVRILSDLISMDRIGYASIFGSIVVDETGLSHFKVETPHYSGNLLPEFFSGNPEIMKKRMGKVKADNRLQLYLTLYKEALKEQNVELAYFRYWNLMETIARGKNFIGQPLCQWDGSIIQNRKGQNRSIQDDASELVYELIRKTFLSENINSESYAPHLNQGLISELVKIWYRHRNCMVHTGGCFPNDCNHCLRNKDNYINCKKAHDEIVSSSGVRDKFYDGYLRSLREVARKVMEVECS